MSISSLSSVSAAGMNAAWNSLGASAGRIAGAATQQALSAVQPVDISPARSAADSRIAAPSLETDLVDQLQAKNAFLVNLRVFKTGDELLGSVINLKA